MKATNCVDNFIDFYDNLCQKYGDVDVETALDIMIGRINNQCMYVYGDEEYLNCMASKCPYFFAIQINDELYAIPNNVIDGKLCPVNILTEEGKTNHQLISSICRDLDKILSINEDIEVDFQSFKMNMNGKLRNVFHIFDREEHVKIDKDAFKSLVIKIHNYMCDGESKDWKLNKLIFGLYKSTYVGDVLCMNFSEYSSFVGSVFGYDLLNKPYVIKPVKSFMVNEKHGEDENDEDDYYDDMEVVDKNKDGKWEVVKLEDVKFEKKVEEKKVEEKEDCEKENCEKRIQPKRIQAKKVEEKEDCEVRIQPKKIRAKKVEEKKEDERRIQPKKIRAKKVEEKEDCERRIQPKRIPPKKYVPKKTGK